MSERVPLSKKLRFEVFKRDGFRCAYCGATPSETVILECDHINPVAAGGTNDIDNLVTACEDCNRGKSATPLSSVPQSLEEKSAEAAERETQIRAYYKILEERKARRDEELWSIADVFMSHFKTDTIDRRDLASIRGFLDQLDYFEVLEAAEIANDRKPYSHNQAWKYFCGICWRKIKRNSGGDV
jgi:hypothetical protein